jgi:D-tyrosyl-tRNA(Tyr) deacylase
LQWRRLEDRQVWRATHPFAERVSKSSAFAQRQKNCGLGEVRNHLAAPFDVCDVTATDKKWGNTIGAPPFVGHLRPTKKTQMKAVVQRVTQASVTVGGAIVGSIGRGLLVLLGLHRDDTAADADWMIQKLLALRVFEDADGKLNRSVTDISGGILIVSQFTLLGDAKKGARPSFTEAMPPELAKTAYEDFMRRLRAATLLRVEEGRFAAMMQVSLVNDGPVTILLDSRQKRSE